MSTGPGACILQTRCTKSGEIARVSHADAVSNNITGKHNYIPVTLMIPEGCILLFTTMAHAGFGVWQESESIYRPVPSIDEALATDTSTWEPRLHFHVGRGEHGVVRSEMVVPDGSVRAETMKSLVNYIHVDHWEDPPVLKPPIFLPPEHLRQHLVERSGKRKAEYHGGLLDTS